MYCSKYNFVQIGKEAGVLKRGLVYFFINTKLPFGGNCDVTSVIILFSEQHTSIVKASLERIFASQILKTAT